MGKGVLVDITKCTGCGKCVIACKIRNGQDFRLDETSRGENAILNDTNWTVISSQRAMHEGATKRRSVKLQCFHCIDPACASACMSKAIIKTAQGSVVYDPKLCVGCRYCMLACPFSIPKYEWDKVLPSITKCDFCYTETANGNKPACVDVCPPVALVFGEREELLKIAKERLAQKDKYIKHIFGETEAGGTQWLYITDVPFNLLGFKDNIKEVPLPYYTDRFMKYTPTIFLVGGLFFSLLSFYTKRCQEVALAEKKENQVGTKNAKQ